ncbi:MAG: hypothetical protein AAF655_10670 [Bacteroidota bacterium]
MNLIVSPLGACIFFLYGFCYYPFLELEVGFSSLCLGLGVAAFHICLGYLLVSKYHHTPIGEFFRGAIIGLNAAANTLIIGLSSGYWWVAWSVGILALMSSFLVVSRFGFYHSCIGWLNWLLPMSWPVNLVGLLWMLVNACLALMIAPFGIPSWRIRIGFEPKTCTITVYGGCLGPFPGFTACNMGNIVFFKPGGEYLLLHEIGHLLSLSVMGFVFHYVGGIDESYVQRNYWEAYAEYLADSYNHPTNLNSSMWR